MASFDVPPARPHHRHLVDLVDHRLERAGLDAPLQGKFENGVGTFFGEDTFEGKPIRLRFIWSEITATHARWEQAFSPDGGATWEVNWVMHFDRVS